MLTDTHVKFTYDTDKHLTTCTRNVHNRLYIGHSQCHPHDYDFESKLVGQHYAYTRSMIREMCALRDDYKTQLKMLKHVYNIYEQNDDIAIDSVECKVMRRQMRLLERDIQEMKELISTTRKDLRTTMLEKDKLYDKLRAKRASNSVNN